MLEVSSSVGEGMNKKDEFWRLLRSIPYVYAMSRFG